MNKKLSRREFTSILGLGAGALILPGLTACIKPEHFLKIGYTFITWGYRSDVLEEAVKNISALGYHSFETFGWVLEEWEKDFGGIGRLIDEYNLPLRSAFCMLKVLDESAIEEESKRLDRWCRILKKNDGTVIVFTGSGKRNEDYKYMDHRDAIVKSTNAYAAVAAKNELVFAYHQHTNTPVETREELYDLVDHVDTGIVKLAPDIGQLLKGGTDPVEVVRDFLPIISHVHLKDYSGGEAWAGYCPLGQGRVDIPEVMKVLENGKFTGSVMAELDPGNDPPVLPNEAARISRDYLAGMGYEFKPA